MAFVKLSIRLGTDFFQCSVPNFIEIKVAVSTPVTISARWFFA